MSPLARRTAQIIEATMTSVDGKRPRWNCSAPSRGSLYLSHADSAEERKVKVFHSIIAGHQQGLAHSLSIYPSILEMSRSSAVKLGERNLLKEPLQSARCGHTAVP